MVDDPEDKWSYGVTADGGAEELWPPPPPPPEPGVTDTARLRTGRWTSPSMGAYDPSPSDPIGTDPRHDAYFQEFGAGPAAADRPAPAAGFGPGFAVDGQGHPGNGLPGQGYDDVAADDATDAEEARARASEARRNAIEWTVVLVGAVLLALILRAVLLQAFYIPSPSMETTLLVNDRVLVNKVSYRLHDINRGDVLVFRRTDEEIARDPSLPHDVIKRVIALGGETIRIEDNQVFIDDQLLLEPYLDEDVITTDFGPETVPEGHIFVMGDNRELSLDSRYATGPVAEDRVVGRAFLLFWPLGRMGAL